ncbi:hypothetical protein QF000_006490 [Paraburkholderia atlantica]
MLMKTFGPLEGRCNICGELARLTEDHTPPKGLIRIGTVQLHHLTHRLSPSESTARWRNFQNGVKYRTICASCNNGLGFSDDPALIDFSQAVANVMATPGLYGARSACPQNIMRSVLGHLSAQGVDRYVKGPSTENIAWYLTDRSVTLPTSVRIHWWPYPFRHQVLARDCAFLDVPSGHVTPLWIMKFFPLAFVVALNCPPALRLPGIELSAYRDCLDGERQLLEIDCRSIVHQHWPEAPTDESILAFGQEAAFALEVTK